MKNTETLTAKLDQFNTRLHKGYGEQKMIVECNAEINGENYRVEFSRSPITGEVQSVKCFDREENTTTENTLVSKVVEEMVWDSLQGD